MKKNIMVSLPVAQYEELEKMSFWLGASKSRVIQQALLVLMANLREVSNNAVDKTLPQ